MPGIAEVELAGIEVEQSDEHGDEHGVLVIVVGESGVHAGGDLVGHHVLGGKRAEESCGLCHEKRGWHTFSAYIAETEIELVAKHQVAVKVAAYFLGGHHRGIHVESLTVWEEIRHHRHLDVPCDA